MRETFQISLCIGLLFAGFQFIVGLIFFQDASWNSLISYVALLFFAGIIVGFLLSFFRVRLHKQLDFHLRREENLIIEDYGELKDGVRYKSGRILFTDHRIIFERRSVRYGIEKAEIPLFELDSWGIENTTVGAKLILYTTYSEYIFKVKKAEKWKEELGFRSEKIPTEINQ